MRTIFLIDDYSPYSRNAAQFALQVAEIIQAKILVGTFKVPVESSVTNLSGASTKVTDLIEEEAIDEEHISGQLKLLNSQRPHYDCRIEEMDISSMNVNLLAQFINTSNVTMLIKAAQCGLNNLSLARSFDMQSVLNQINVPVCLVPAGWKPSSFKSLAYLTDLRYCRTDILSHLYQLTGSSITVYVAHMAIPGTADLSPDYAVDLFNDFTAKSPQKQPLFFHHIKQSASITVADVLVNSMDTDALVLTNHSAHFKQLIGDDLSIRDPDGVNVPLLLYPA